MSKKKIIEIVMIVLLVIIVAGILYIVIIRKDTTMENSEENIKIEEYIENVNVPISEYFPEIQNANSDFAKQITIWNLLTHTSGIAISDTENWKNTFI